MRSRRLFMMLALCAPLAAGIATAGPGASSEPTRPPAIQNDARSRPDADLPLNKPIVAKVLEIDEDAGRVTLETPHGEVALEISDDLAQRLSPGDVVVLRLTDDDEESDFPSASPREDLGPEPAQKI